MNKRHLAMGILLVFSMYFVCSLPINNQVDYLYISPDDWKWWLDGGWVHMWVQPDEACTAYIYENESLIDTASIITDGTNFQWEGASEGHIEVGVKCDTGSSNQWLNFTYLVALNYDYTKIRIFTQTGDTLPFDMFDVYINDTIIYHAEDYLDTSKDYKITVNDIWGTTLNETTFTDYDRHFDIEVAVYKLYVKNFGTDFRYIRITKAGYSEYSEPNYLTPGEEGIWYLFNGDYELQIYDIGIVTMINNIPVTISGESLYWVISGVNAETLMQYLRGLYTMTAEEYSGLMSAVGEMNVVTSSFGMVFWLLIIIAAFAAVMVLSMFRQKQDITEEVLALEEPRTMREREVARIEKEADDLQKRFNRLTGEEESDEDEYE